MPDSEDRKWREEFRGRSFEVQKHVATLSTAASLLILAVYRERPFEADLLAITLILLAISAVISVQGMTSIALYERRPLRPIDPDADSFDRYIYRLTSAASNILTAGVIVFALFLFDVPFWTALGVVGAILVVLVMVLLRRRRRNIRRTRRTTTPRRD